MNAKELPVLLLLIESASNQASSLPRLKIALINSNFEMEPSPPISSFLTSLVNASPSISRKQRDEHLKIFSMQTRFTDF